MSAPYFAFAAGVYSLVRVCVCFALERGGGGELRGVRFVCVGGGRGKRCAEKKKQGSARLDLFPITSF